MLLALRTGDTITFSIVGFFALIAVLVFLRLILRRQENRWRRLRVGFFVERENDDTAESEAITRTDWPTNE